MKDAIGLRPARVLAVDDQHANLVTLDAVLGAQFDLVRASSGPEAIALLESRRDVDVILMDAQMPGMDGFETASRIKAMPGCADIPIVFITAVYNEDPFIKRGYQVGAVDYFSKPFDPEILKVKVAIYASFRQKAQMLEERARQVREAEELMKEGRKLSAMLDQMKVAVVVTDTMGRIRQANAEVHALSTSVAKNACEDTILGWWRRDGAPVGKLPDPLSRALAQGETTHDACFDMHGAYGIRSLLCTASPLRAPDGAVSGAVFIVHDATERKALERDLEKRIGRLVRAGVELQAQ